MAQGPDWKQLIETGMSFTEMRRSQARKFVADLVAQGQLAQDRAAATVDEVLEASRRRREDLRSLVQTEIQRQVHALGIATRDDLARLERKLTAGVDGRPRRRRPRPRRPPAKKGSGEDRPKTTPAAGRGRACRASVRRRLDTELVRRGLAPSRAPSS